MSPVFANAALIATGLVIAVLYLAGKLSALGARALLGAAFLLCITVGVFLLAQSPSASSIVIAAFIVVLGILGGTMVELRTHRRRSIHDQMQSLIGQMGTTTTGLSPRGSVQIGTTLWDAESISGLPIAKDQAVVVVEANGLPLQVTPSSGKMPE